MTLNSSQSMNTNVPLSDEVASEDMVERNDAGQNVVLVPKGQRIPLHLLAKPKAKKVSGPAENKARKGPKG